MIDSTYRRALITDTSSGISNATALVLAKANSSLTIVGRSEAIAVDERGNSVRSKIVCPRAVNPPILDTNTVQSDFYRAGILTLETGRQTILRTVSLPSHADTEDVIIMPSSNKFQRKRTCA